MMRGLLWVALAAGCGAGQRPGAGGLTIRASAEGANVDVVLHNGGSAPLRLLTRIDAGEAHYDWFTLVLRDASGGETAIHPSGDRDESSEVIDDVSPGGEVVHRVDVARWNAEETRPAPPGPYTLTVIYEVPASDATGGTAGVWTGRVEAAPVAITLP
jgi:hypothetical protein